MGTSERHGRRNGDRLEGAEGARFQLLQTVPTPHFDRCGDEIVAFHYSACLALDVPKVAVRNEDLRDHPAATMTSLCAALGIDHRPDQHEFWRHEHHHLFGSSSASEQVQIGASTPEAMVTDEFEERWNARSVVWDQRVQRLAETLRAIDTSVVDAPVRGPVGPDPLSVRDWRSRTRSNG